MAKAKGYINLHLAECPKGIKTHEFATYEEQASPTSTFTYQFTPTGIGDIKHVRCDLCDWVSPEIYNPEVEP